MKKVSKVFKRIVIIVLVAIVCLAVAFKIYTHNYYRTDISITDNIKEILSDDVHSYSTRDGMVFIPQRQKIKAVIVFYPGGKVEYTSYNGLMYELAARGYLCLLPRMPENLALLRTNAVDNMTSDYLDRFEEEGDLDWYLAGHSLGGVAAAVHIDNNLIPTAADTAATLDEADKLPEYKGLILCASYPTVDLSDTNLRLLSIYGSNDQVLDLGNYEESKELWPEDSEEHIINGGIHSFFGSYGIQSGDGTPEISNYEQITQTANIIADWVSD